MAFTNTGDFDTISTNTCPSIHNDITDDTSIITNYTYDIKGTGSYSPPCKRKPKLVTTYPVLAPLKGKGYFKPRERQAKTVVGVLIPFYNEGRQELKRTLESLHGQEIECRDLGVEFVYLAILDGISEADESTIQYINEIYNDSHWADAMLRSEDRSYVSVLQAAPTDELGDHGLVEIAPGKHMRLTTLVKGINMRKTNSHEWFFVAFCSEYEIDYAFGTDCGTLYAQGCLYYLIDYLNTHPDVSAVTGRQRVMSSSMQSLRTEGLMQMWYRAVQAYDYEASISSFLGAFSLIGMLPVIPGPAGLWRMSVVGGKPMDYYIDYVNSIKPEDGLIMGNLLLAEDRILSYAACLMTGKYTRWVPKAVFYTEAETDSKSFLTQRRRWINGTSASYLYLLFFSPGVIFRGSHSWWFKIVIYSQLLLQTILYAVRTVSPGVFAALIYFAVKSLNIGGDGYNQLVAWGITSCGALLYIVFCLTHFFSKFSRSLYNAVVVWNSISYMLVVAGLTAAFANADPIAILVLLLAVFMPFFLALLHSLDVFIMMVFSFFQFCAFWPIFIPWFSAYAYCRVWDLSWGNRPSSGSAKGKKSVKTGILHRRIGLVVLLLVMCLNFTVCGLFVRYNSLQGLMVMSMVFVGIALFQQILSFGFYLFYTEHILSAGVRNLTRRSMQILSATLFATTVACVFTGLFTTSWLTNSFPVEQRFNITVTLNETFMKWEDIFRSDYNETFYTLQDSVIKSSSETLEDANATDIHSFVLKSSNETIEDANVMDIYNYVRTEVVTVTTLYRLDALRELEGKIFLPNHRINAYYVNNSVVTTITTNYTVNEDGSIGNKLTNVMHDFLSYLNLTYTDDYDRVYVGISTPPDTTYKARYQKKSFLNQTFVQMKADITTSVEGGSVDMYYGLLFFEFDFHTVVPYKSETMLWGSDLMWHFPNQLWAYTLLLIFGCVIFLGLIMLACLYALCTKDRSRVYGVSVLYVWLTICALMAAILLFPMSFFDLKTNRVGWWDVEVSASSGYLCGESAHYYNPGDCSLDWSYWLIVVSFFTAVLSYNSAQIGYETYARTQTQI
ncbi:hypothetical protein SARC_00623 [Sphaeroforma arctica JP610]|uniref:chitin synthase n=1 Tax=Sphaeroforma arctica JP610 TaxID=667725 RepID=A0A0L0GDY3_9EUKA|nr:hypothetical protein SARC_00623 [Sphaeroforma arctica JP610]KNC87237.1 hypothetical protein SARC_00623 [Sphaeroforma arctica JP610]|eukprot:XP_014161139.1 hypothetical protein SARC_00623 [Sphaeroforma arctica JP610]